MAAAFMWGCWTGLLGIQAMCKTILCGRNGCFFCRKYMVRHELKTLWFMTKSRFLHCPTRMSISVSAKSTNSSKCLVLWFETTSMPGVAKLFDPRAEFATAWPPQGRIQWQAAVNDVALLCTFGNMVLQECVRYLTGRMWPAGRTSATATPVLCLCYNSMDMFIQNLAPPLQMHFSYVFARCERFLFDGGSTPTFYKYLFSMAVGRPLTPGPMSHRFCCTLLWPDLTHWNWNSKQTIWYASHWMAADTRQFHQKTKLANFCEKISSGWFALLKIKQTSAQGKRFGINVIIYLF